MGCTEDSGHNDEGGGTQSNNDGSYNAVGRSKVTAAEDLYNHGGQQVADTADEDAQENDEDEGNDYGMTL